MIALLAGNVLPLTPVLILWMNMATSATLSFGLAFEAGEKYYAAAAARSKVHVMDGFAIWRVAFLGSMIAVSAFILEAWLQPRDCRRSLFVPCCCRLWSPPSGSIC